MKTLRQFTEAQKQGLDIQDNAINYIEVGELKKYLEIADKFLSDDAKFVVNWLIENNSTYLQKFGDHENALKGFYDKGVPKDETLKPLYGAIGRLKKEHRLLEIPVFLTKEQFDGILDKSICLDDLLLDLSTEKGRTDAVNRYNPLVWKIARSYNGKSGLTLEELYSAGLEGLTWAINSYGKKSNKKMKKEKELGEEITDMKAYKSLTFLSFAGFMIRSAIMEAIKNESHTVRVAVSQQRREREETGRNTKSNSISGDKMVGHDNDGHGKSLFDYIDDGHNGLSDIDKEDVSKIWPQIYSILDKEFDKKTLDIFYHSYGLRDYKKIPKKELAAKYNVVPSNITSVLWRVKCFILKNKKTKELFMDLRELMAENALSQINPLTDDVHHV